MNDDGPELFVRFVEGLRKGYGANAFCCAWIDEIHVDVTLKDHPALDDMIKHEKKHYRFFQRIMATNSSVKAYLLMVWNNVWDFFDVIRIHFKYYEHFRKNCFEDMVFVWAMILVFVYLIKVLVL